MPVKIFKLLKSFFISPLTILINNSINRGIYPNKLKLARIVPILKSGDEQNPADNRPISCLPYLGKLFERCAANRLLSFCKKFSIISDAQFGFQKNKSTCDALVHLTELIYRSLNEKKFHLAVLIDLKKAFDTVNHNILLKKLEFYGVRGLPLVWFRSYLSNRRWYVNYKSATSSEAPITTGVPQGSILGPILFRCVLASL